MLPAIHIYILVSMLNYLTKESYLSKLAELIKTVLVWIMKTILAGVVGLNLVQSHFKSCYGYSQEKCVDEGR